MVGMGSSIAKQLGNVVGNWLKNPLSRAFVFWYYLPAAGFVFLQHLVIGPLALGAAPPNFIAGLAAGTTLPTDTQGLVAFLIDFLGRDVVWLIIVPTVIGVLLSALSLSITRMFEGYPFQSNLLAWKQKRYEARRQKQYGRVAELRSKRREKLNEVEALKERHAELTARIKKASEAEGRALQAELETVAGQFSAAAAEEYRMREELAAVHRQIEADGRPQRLPMSADRVTPTALGNALAVAEEYPFDRYGMDAVLFWPYLRAELAPERVAGLDETKAALDGLLNLALLSYLYAVEAFLVAVLPGNVLRAFAIAARIASEGAHYEPTATARLILASTGAAGLLLGYLFYLAAVRAAEGMGLLLKTFFDFHREQVLEKFKLTMPRRLEDEQKVWWGLGAFLRRGEPFYFPDDYRKAETASKKGGDAAE